MSLQVLSVAAFGVVDQLIVGNEPSALDPKNLSILVKFFLWAGEDLRILVGLPSNGTRL